ncbi:MAG: HEPN domain-containing protein [Bacteroidetes bacterium]|nr:HEPN domain-containing protein [Bacteroidota bacterium]
MSDHKPDYIEYRLSKADEAFHDAELLAENNSWNSCINRLYYACYYAVSALLLKNGISTHTHAGLKTQFNQHFVKANKIDKEFGKLYADLMDWRQKGDYGDMFDFAKEFVEPLFEPVKQFIDKIKELIL